MTKELLESQWAQIRGFLKERFQNLTDEDIKYINGRYDHMIERLEQRYGFTKMQAEDAIHRFLVDKFPGYFAAEKAYVKPIRTEREAVNPWKWVALAALPLLAILGLLNIGHPKYHETVVSQPTVVGREMGIRAENPADLTISSEIRRVLSADRLVSRDLPNIHIVSDNGIVTITGSVPTIQERDEVLQVVQHASGVKQVNDLMEVRAS